MKRASENGLHRRFYANHREELKRKKSEIGKNQRRRDPLFGVWRDLRSGDTKESAQLSKNLAVKLISLIDKVNEGGVTPETVNASCNAAAQVYKILRLNFDMKKSGF